MYMAVKAEPAPVIMSRLPHAKVDAPLQNNGKSENRGNELTMEAIHQQVADEAPIILWMTGQEGRHLYFNSRWREFTGLDNTDDPEGKI